MLLFSLACYFSKFSPKGILLLRKRWILAKAYGSGKAVDLAFWGPPNNYIPPPSTPAITAAISGSMAELEKTAKEQARTFSKSQKGNLRRLCCRLEGDECDSNLKRICTALGLKNQGPKANAVAIELRLRHLEFDDAAFEFTPTAADMELSPVAFAARMEIKELSDCPGYFLRVHHSIAQICAKLEQLLAWHAGVLQVRAQGAN